MSQFKIELNATVTIDCSDETGVVIGRAEYSNSENQYYVRYRANDGRATEAWWSEGALTCQDEDGE